MVLFYLERLTDADREDREAEALERGWRQSIVAIVIGFLGTLGLFWPGFYLLTQ